MVYLVAKETVLQGRTCFAIKAAFAILGLALNYGGAETGAEPRVVGWEKPEPNCYKFNIDACFFPNVSFLILMQRSVAAVLRDHKGRVVAGKTWIEDNFLNATTSEASAFLRGLQHWLRIWDVLQL
jgi:hypothetical protein